MVAIPLLIEDDDGGLELEDGPEEAVLLPFEREEAPLPRPPDAIGRDYTRRIHRRMRPAYDAIRHELMPDLRSFWKRRQDSLDDLGDVLGEIAEIQGRTSFGDEAGIMRDAVTTAADTSAFQKDQLARQVRASLDLTPRFEDEFERILVRQFVADNTMLIKDVDAELWQKISDEVVDSFEKGRSWSKTAERLEKRLGISSRRARTIARDQSQKLHGRYNRHRQMELGVQWYFWMTMGDGGVRPLHFNRHGERYHWNTSHSDGHPGEPINCRCGAFPDFSDLDRRRAQRALVI